jgi:multicomponent Na+:H+ antiporter subunit A
VLWMVLIPLIAAAGAPWLHRLLRAHVATLLAVVPVGVATTIAARLPLEPAAAWSEVLPWIPDLGIALAFRFDGLSATFGLLICGIGALVLLYAGSYMRTDPRLGRLCGLLLLFLGAMLGVVFSDDVFVLFVFWELTSIASYLLIGFKHDKQEARDAARQALLVTGAGGLALLAGLVLLTIVASQTGVSVAEVSRISVLATVDLSGHTLFVPALLLIVLGAFSKSAQMPLHFWLPNAMTAPTPVSAYLHSATMVKAGIFLLARMNPVFGDSLLWHLLLTATGAVTMLIAAAMAAGQTDLKRILAYTTVSVLGTLTMLIGVGTELAIKAAVVFLVAHACYKAALFMIAGSLEHATGTRDIHKLSGLFRVMPVTAISGMLAALSMAGAPPLFGFIGKELLLKAKLDLEYLGVVLILVASLANVFLIAMALVVAVWPFFGRRSAAAQSAHEAPFPTLVGPLLLAVIGLFVGLIPGTFDSALGSATATAIGGRPIVMELKLWHGVSPVALTALGISIVTLTTGFVLFLRLRDWLTHIAVAVTRIGQRGPARIYDLAFAGLLALADRVTRLTQTGSLRQYVRVILLTLILTCLYPLSRCFPASDELSSAWYWHEILLVLLTLVGAIAAVFSRSRMSAVALLGITGLLIAILFALFSAPDLAITQIMVEALTVILLVLIFYRLPEFSELRTRLARLADALVAVTAGAIMAGLVLATAALHLPSTVSEQLARMSKPEAYGRNIVNVILVDFRALDTLGEITVVAVAGLGVYALIKLRRRRKAEGGAS